MVLDRISRLFAPQFPQKAMPGSYPLPTLSFARPVKVHHTVAELGRLMGSVLRTRADHCKGGGGGGDRRPLRQLRSERPKGSLSELVLPSVSGSSPTFCGRFAILLLLSLLSWAMGLADGSDPTLSSVTRSVVRPMLRNFGPLNVRNRLRFSDLPQRVRFGSGVRERISPTDSDVVGSGEFLARLQQTPRTEPSR